jgi:hypothetical protein
VDQHRVYIGTRLAFYHKRWKTARLSGYYIYYSVAVRLLLVLFGGRKCRCHIRLGPLPTNANDFAAIQQTCNTSRCKREICMLRIILSQREQEKDAGLRLEIHPSPGVPFRAAATEADDATSQNRAMMLGALYRLSEPCSGICTSITPDLL